MKFTRATLFIACLTISFLGFSQSDNCASATVLDLSSGSACSIGSTVGATSTNTMYGACNAVPANEVWYTYVSNGADNDFTITSLGITNAEIVIYTGGCAGTLELCNTVGGAATLNSSWGITAGTQVWIGVMSNQGTEGSFELCVDSNQPDPTGGNACSGAIPICDVNAVLSLDMSTMSSSGDFPSCFFASVNQDVWFSFTVTQTGTIEWEATPTGATAGVELDWAIYDITGGCPGVEVACNYNYASASGASAGMNPSSCVACPTDGFLPACAEFCDPMVVTAGNTYVIMVDYFTGGATGTMDFGFTSGTTALIAPVADFTINPSSFTCGPSVNVDITNNSVGGPQEWDFGNGNTYTGTNPPNQNYTTPGVYAITEVIDGDCPSVHTEFVELYGPLAATAVATDVDCLNPCGGTAEVTSVSGGDGVYTYLWSNAGETTNSVTGLCAGNYTVTISNALCGTSIDVPVTVGGAAVVPNAEAGPTLEITCANPSIALDGSLSSAGMDYSWTGPGITGGATTMTPTVNQAGTYTITVTDPGSGCSSTDDVIVTSDLTPPAANAGSPQELTCIDLTAVLGGSSATPGATFSWSGPGIVSGGSTATPTVNQVGNYVLTVTDPTNGCTNTANVNVTEDVTPPLADAGPDAIISCATSTVDLDGTGSDAGMNYSWSGPGITANGTTTTPTVNQAGLYTITVTNPVNGCVSTANVNVTNDLGIPVANAGPDDELTCVVTSLPLDGSGSAAGMDYSWSGPGIVSGGTTTTPTVDQPGTYTITVTDTGNGCVNTDDVIVTEDVAIPVADAGPDQELTCAVTTVLLDGSGSDAGMDYSWSGPGIVAGGTTTAPTVDQSGLYTITVTNAANGCMNTANVNVTEDITPPDANAGGPQELTCTDLTQVLNGSSATGGATFSWAGPGIVSGGSTATPTVNQIGNYVLTVTDPTNGCTNTANVNVTEDITPPLADAGPDAVISCATNSVDLDGTGSDAGMNYSWSGPGITANGTTTTPTVNQAGLYTITVTNPVNGCVSTANVNVTNDLGVPAADAGPDDELTCAVTSLPLDGSGSAAGMDYSWSGPGIVSGGTTTTPTIDQPGTYTITVTDPGNGCVNTDDVIVTEDVAIPVADAGPDQQLTCVVTTVPLDGSGSDVGMDYSWAGPGIIAGGNTAAPTVDQPGLYTITVTNMANGCVSTADVNVTEDITPPVANAGPDGQLTCTITSIQLDGSASDIGMDYSWAGPGIVAGGNSTTPTVNQVGTYTLTVTDPSNGCISTATADVTEDITPPVADAGADQVLSCATTSIQLDGSLSSAGMDYSWAGPSITAGGTTMTPTVDQSGTYTLTVTNPSNGCWSASTVDVTDDVGTPVANAGMDQELTCVVTSVQLDGSASSAGMDYSWAGPGIVSGGTTMTPTVDQSGTYTITVTNVANGCWSTATVDVTENITPPNADAGATQELTCVVTTIQLDGSLSSAGMNYSWSGPGIIAGGSTTTPTVDQPGNYTITVTNNLNGCTSTDNVNVSEDIAIPMVNFVADTLFGCDALNVNFQEASGQAGMEYDWNFGDGNTANSGPAIANYYSMVGCFDVSLTVTNPVNGCTNSESILSYICLIAAPNAAFTATPNSVSSEDGMVTFTDASTNATTHEWDFGDGSNGTSEENPTHDYSQNVGTYTVQLVVSNQELCYDTAWRTIRVIEEEIFYVPNTFTPDGDNYNEYFRPVFTSGFDPYDFTLYIFNRWGEVVWESHDYSVGWDGTYGGNLVPDGVYTWKIEVKTTRNDERRMYTGHVNIIR